jgi:DNA polymerase-3 subunit alpha
MTYVNLHGHSHYSLLDGLGSPKRIVERAKELGMPAVAITDHGNMYGAIEFYQAAKEAGIKPIVGCEIYMAKRSRFDKEAQIDNKPYHLTLLVKDFKGYQNLMEIVTKAHLEGFYYKPRADYGLLKAHSEGLIALSGCLQANLPRAVLSGNLEEAEEVIKKHIEIFGKENYFLELQDHPFTEDQAIANEAIIKLAKKFKLGLVATNDSHYPRREDAEAHDVLICIQTQTTIADENRMKYLGDYSMREPADMEIAFKDVPEALENTLKIAEMCNLELDFGKNLIPAFKTPQNENPDIYLTQLCEEGLKNRFKDKDVPGEYKKRLEYELETVKKMGFSTYFLIVHDFVKFAKDSGIVVGPGRGSAAGSIIAYSLRITELDPIAHGLFFERFLNPERVSMPDIDIDFADDRRIEVLNYVIEKYGRENVAQIITFGTMAAKAAVRDVGRALGFPYVEADRLAKLVPPPVLGKHAPLSDSIKEDPDLRGDYENNPRSKKLLDFAVQLEGTVRHAGTHACAVVIAEEPLIKYTPMQKAAGESEDVITQYSMKPIENIGLLKMDFLGLKNLTIIEKTKKIVKRTHEVEIDIANLDMNDEKTFQLLQKADTTGVFQLESAGMRRYLKDLEPSKFEDIVAMGALYRPGPMEWIPNYIKGKHHPEKVAYLHPSFKNILAETYGVAVYQEQILQIARDFAGFSLGEADILRKAVGKKNPKLLAEQREKFVNGAIKQGHKKSFAEEVFEKVIEPFAGYGFNKAHAACYGLIAYQTAYLKAHYPTEFMTSLLCSDYGDTDRIVLEINECEEMGISVLPPSINESFANFTVIDNEIIRFGLMAIKGIGEGSVKEIINVRNAGGAFKNIEDFAKRVPFKILNKKLIEALALSGALDEFGDRKRIAESFEEISAYAKYIQQSQAQGQTDIFGALDEQGVDSGKQEFHFKEIAESTPMERLKWEKEYLGMYVSGHPLAGLKKYLKKKVNLIGELTKLQVGKMVKIAGLASGIRKILTKSGGYMMIFVIEDLTARIEAAIFPKKYNELAHLVTEDSPIVIEGKFDARRDSFTVSCENIKKISLETMIEKAKESKMYDSKEKVSRHIPFVGELFINEATDEIENFDISDVVLEKGDVYGKPDGADVSAYVITLSANVEKNILDEIKKLMMKYKGERNVVIHIPSGGKLKRIKVPFGVSVNGEFEKELDKLINK